MGKYAIEMVANGLALKHDNFAVIPAASGDSFPGTGASTNVSADAM